MNDKRRKEIAREINRIRPFTINGFYTEESVTMMQKAFSDVFKHVDELDKANKDLSEMAANLLIGAKHD